MSGEELQNAAVETVVKKKRGGKQFSLEQNITAAPDAVSCAIVSATRYIKAEPVKSDEECSERIERYFDGCAERGELPRWENLALCLGVSRAAAWNWATGKQCSAARTRMMQRAKDILASIDAELVSKGKIPQVVYIFRAKNFYEMRDQQDVVLTPNNPLGDSQTTEELTEKYSMLIDLDGEG